MSSRSLEGSVGGVAPPAGFFDRTFRKGRLVRCSAVLMIAINYALFIIGFMTAVYGLRLGSQEFQQMEFLRVRTPPRLRRSFRLPHVRLLRFNARASSLTFSHKICAV